MKTPPLQWTIELRPPIQKTARFTFKADVKELGALKDYIEAEDMLAFTADVMVEPLGEGRYRASGTFEANAVQASVVNLEAVQSTISESFSVTYWPAAQIPQSHEAVSIEAEDPEPLTGDEIPIGALLSELLAVAIDPYPRNEGERLAWVQHEDTAGSHPFASLINLRRKASSDGR